MSQTVGDLAGRVVSTDGAPFPAGPYVQAMTASAGTALVFVSGQLPLGSDGSLVNGGPGEQVEKALTNALAVVRAAGGTAADVVRVVVYTTALDKAAEINQAYQGLLGAHLPARSMVGISALPLGAAVEVEMTAAVPEQTPEQTADGDKWNRRMMPMVEFATDDAVDDDTVPSGLDVGSLRRDTPAVASTAYLNTGTAGPLLAPAAAAMARLAQEELLVGRIGPGFRFFRETLSTLRATLAGLMGAGEDEIALTHHTTEGMNIVTWGLPWRPGDRVVTTSLEHGGGLLPLYQLHRRFGVTVDFAKIGRGGAEETLAAIAKALETPARLVVLSHVTYGTGATLPVAEIVTLAHSRGVLVAVDGAQSAGAIPLDFSDLGVDFYAFPGQKWLCGPEGTGGLYVRRELLDELAATFIGFRGVDHDRYRADDPDSLAAGPGAARYEVGSLYRPGIVGLLEAARWHSETGDRLKVTARIHDLAAYTMAAVAKLPGAELLTPENHAGLVCFTVPGVDPRECVTYLSESGVSIRSIPENGALRISCGFFNTREEIDRTLSLISNFQLRA